MRAMTSCVLITVLLSANSVAGADPVSQSDWAGTWKGFIDGRPATLVITGPRTNTSCRDSVNPDAGSPVSGTAPSGVVMNVTLTDDERGGRWQRTCINAWRVDGPGDGRSPSQGFSHMWKELVLTNVNSGRNESVGDYYLHTWDREFISGVSTWKGKQFGRLFIKQGRTVPTP